MSVFEEDITNDILGEDLERNISDNELPGTDDEQNNEQNENQDQNNDNPKPVEPKKRTVRNPKHTLKVQTLKGPRGIHTIEKYFDGIKYRGKGYEKQDLNEVMKRLQHWAHRMFPTYSLDDILEKVEKFGKKKELQVYMTRYRLGQLEGELIPNTEDDIEPELANINNEPFDEFDALLDEQIAISKLAPRTPGSRSMSMSSSVFNTPKLNEHNAAMSTPYPQNYDDLDNLAQPLPSTPIPSTQKSPKKLTAEQLARIAENRRIAIERLKAKKEAQGTK
ncbi:protein TIPIN homolog [Condylostylus longicornis]|uniref:protein TIPIN homolog n=1 Tax=Condylostylus longicornis TaxID=2530218 RepID=UPI00244E183A|nr:protein TIPIN homolog [Condylostylus longicornis]